MQLPEYMQSHFPGLNLGPAIFYSWNVGMRFELNSDHWPNVKWDAVLHRAATLYRSVFRPGDIGFLVSGEEWDFEHKNRPSRRMPARCLNSVFSLSRKESLGLHGIAGRKRIITYQDRISKVISTYRWTAFQPLQIGYERILQAVMHKDFPNRKPRIEDRVYFVNVTRNIILQMYDDRGLDIIASAISDLRSIYEAHKDWLLDSDRSAIQRMFESNQPIPNFDYHRIPRPW